VLELFEMFGFRDSVQIHADERTRPLFAIAQNKFITLTTIDTNKSAWHIMRQTFLKWLGRKID